MGMLESVLDILKLDVIDELFNVGYAIIGLIRIISTLCILTLFIQIQNLLQTFHLALDVSIYLSFIDLATGLLMPRVFWDIFGVGSCDLEDLGTFLVQFYRRTQIV